jgi:asparagine synthase (glutamine-hydrolysing)
MPGFFGVVDFSSAGVAEAQRELVDTVRVMSAAMLYETSFTPVIVSLPTVGACVGRVGFNDHGRSTYVVRSGAVAMTTDQEIWESESAGTAAPSRCLGISGQKLLQAYEAYGHDALARVAETSAAFVGDAARARCLLFGDRYGRDRLFLHFRDRRVFFSSEAKAILAAVPETRVLDVKGLAELLACGCTLGTQSLFRGIEVLEGGVVLTLDGSGAKRRKYFGPADLERLEQVSEGEFLEGFPASLRSVVNAFAKATPPVGVSLTGGLDSRMIMASLDAPAGSVPCYTFGSMYGVTGDVAVGKAVAAQCQQPHHVVELGQDFLNRAPSQLEQAVYASDGYLGLSGAAELYVNRLARAIAPSRMTGNWGGELMRGVRAFKFRVPRGRFINRELDQQMRVSAADFSPTGLNPLSTALFNQMPLQGYGRYAIERSQVAMRSPFLADEVVRWLYRAPAGVRASMQGAIAVIGQRPELLAIPTDLGLLGRRPRVFRNALRKARIKAEYLTSHGAPDWLARLSSRFPSFSLETRFLGVDKFHHFRRWIRRDLAGFVREAIQGSASSLKTWFDMVRVAEMVTDHIDGRANYTDEIDKILTIATIENVLFGRFASYSVNNGASLRVETVV